MPGWEWLFCAEIEPFPAWVLAQRFGAGRPERMPDPAEAGLSAGEQAERRAAIKAIAKLPAAGRLYVNLGDINAEDFADRAARHGRPDVLVFGSPCQDYSVAGKRLGLDGARGNMALVALAAIKRLRPTWVAFENVPGLLSNYSGSAEAQRDLESRAERGDFGEVEAVEDSDFAAFLTAVSECGYLGAYRITDAQFAGVPQRRRRVFAVFYLGDWRPAAAVLFEPDSMRGDNPPSRETGERVAPTVEACVNAGGAGWGTDFMTGGGLAVADPISTTEDKTYTHEGNSFRTHNLIPGVANPLTARMTKGINTTMDEGQTMVVTAFSGKDYGADAAEGVAPTLRSMEFDGSHANGGGQIAIAFDPTQITSKVNRSTIDDRSPQLTESGYPPALAFQTRIARNGRGQPEEIVPALNGSDAGETSDMRPVVATGMAVRRLTPTECERLQGFEDGHTAVMFNGKPAADGPRYRALGNAMCVKEIRWVLRRIEIFEQNREKIYDRTAMAGRS